MGDLCKTQYRSMNTTINSGSCDEHCGMKYILFCHDNTNYITYDTTIYDDSLHTRAAQKNYVIVLLCLQNYVKIKPHLERETDNWTIIQPASMVVPTHPAELCKETIDEY